MNIQTPDKANATTQSDSRRDDDESRLDAAIAESFPASDPPASTHVHAGPPDPQKP